MHSEELRLNLATRQNMANCLGRLGRHEEAIKLGREVLAGKRQLHGDKNYRTISSEMNLATALYQAGQCDESVRIMRRLLPFSRRELGPDNVHTIRIETNLGLFLSQRNTIPSRDDLLESIAILDPLSKRMNRILGAQHPETINANATLSVASRKLAALAALPPRQRATLVDALALASPRRRATLEDALAAFDL